jgi:prepilin-type processing-associated H-X9-DG protein
VFYEACPSHNFEYRHRDKINVLYLDKHVDALKEDDVPMGRESRYEYFWSEKEVQK